MALKERNVGNVQGGFLADRELQHDLPETTLGTESRDDWHLLGKGGTVQLAGKPWVKGAQSVERAES